MSSNPRRSRRSLVLAEGASLRVVSQPGQPFVVPFFQEQPPARLHGGGHLLQCRLGILQVHEDGAAVYQVEGALLQVIGQEIHHLDLDRRP
jgi:hypothetical protein